MAAGLLVSGTAYAQDSDGDGLADSADVFPCDATRASMVFYPSESSSVMLAFEDTQPDGLDADYNDVVLRLHLRRELDAQGRTVSLFASLDPVALGGDYDNGLGVQLPFARAGTTVEMRVGGGAWSSVPLESTDEKATAVLFENLRALYGGAKGVINARPNEARRSAGRIELRVAAGPMVGTFGANVPIDVFIFRSGTSPRHEIHFPEYNGTAAIDGSKIGTAADISRPGRMFVHRSGLPFALNLMTSNHYPHERVGISLLFPSITLFASSGGTSATQFYAASNIGLSHGHTLADATPPVISGPDLSCIIGSPCTTLRAQVVPLSPTSADDLTCQVSGGGPALHTFLYNWDNGSARVSGPVLPASATAALDTWTCSVRASATLFSCLPVTSAPVTIPNTPPTAPTVTVTPAAPSSSTDVICSASGSTDIDGHAVSYAYEWIRSTGGSLLGQTLPQSVTLAGETWTCNATPTDGYGPGPMGSASVVVADEATSVGSCLEGTAPGAGPTVCEGEDWWLPARVGRSPSGVVTTYASVLDEDVLAKAVNPSFTSTAVINEFGRRLSGTTLNADYSDYLDDPTGTAYKLGRSLYKQNEEDCLESAVDACLNSTPRYSEYTCRYNACLRRPLSASDPFVQAGVTELLAGTTLHFSCPDPAAWTDRRAMVLTGWEGDTGTNMAVSIANGATSMEQSVRAWAASIGTSTTSLSSVVQGSLAGHWASTLDFTDPASYSLMATAMGNVYAVVQALDVNGHVDALSLNGESGHFPYYQSAGFICRRSSACAVAGTHLATWEDLSDWHFDMAATAGVPFDKLMVNIAMGGTEFEPLATRALTEGAGLATHGPFFTNSYRFLQHLPHVRYDEARKAFRPTGPHPFAFLHEDFEVLDHTNNTWGQYRAFRLAVLSAMSVGFDRLLVSAFTIPSVGVPQATGRCWHAPSDEQRCLNYDHAIAKAAGAEDMLKWMYRSVGRRDGTAVEAWCAPVEVGTEGTSGLTFAQRLAAGSFPRLHYSSDRSVYAPLQTFHGVHCALSVNARDRGLPALELNETYTKGVVHLSGGGSDFTDTRLTGNAARNTYPFEGRTTAGTASSRLLMDLDPVVFASSASANVVKIVFRPRSNLQTGNESVITVALEDHATGQSFRVPVGLGFGGSIPSDRIHTLTVPLGAFTTPPTAPVLTITHGAGPHLDYAMVRVIPD